MELVVCSNPAVVNATEDETNRMLLRLLADIKESLLLEVIAVLQPIDIATKRLSCDINRHHLLNFARFQSVIFMVFCGI